MQKSKGNWGLKKEAHDLCEIIWGDFNSAFGNVARQYAWLQQNTRTGHISTLTKEELVQLIKQLRRMARKHGTFTNTPRGQQWWK